MGSASADQEWMRGYETARARCLTLGVELAREQRPALTTATNSAHESGYDWGLWDHEDANGLPHHREQGA